MEIKINFSNKKVGSFLSRFAGAIVAMVIFYLVTRYGGIFIATLAFGIFIYAYLPVLWPVIKEKWENKKPKE